MTRPLRVLHLEDSRQDAELMRDRLDTAGVACDILLVDNKDRFEAALARESFDLIISDYNLPGYDGVTALEYAQGAQPDVPVILISGTLGEEEAIHCLHIGATDYLFKDHLDRLVPAVQRAIEEAEARRTRKRAEMALAESETRKTAILDSVLDCIVTIGADGTVIEFNASAERTFGYTKREAVGRSLTDLIIPPRFRDAHRAGLARYLATGEGPLLGKLIEITALRSDGSEIPVELSITPIHTENAPVFTGVLRDLTSRKQAEAEIKRLDREIQDREHREFLASQERAADLENQLLERREAELALRRERDRAERYLDTAEVVLLMLDVDGRIELINRYGGTVLGWPPDHLLGRDWIETCLPPRIREDFRAKFLELLSGELSVNENCILTRSGEERLIEWRNRPLRDDNGRVIGSFSSGTDITERRMLEEQFRQAQKMEAVGRLAGGIAHDFNNLLTVILGFCELSVSALDPRDPRQADLAEIQNAGQRAAALTRQLLAFSRKEIIELTLLDLNGVVSDLLPMLRRLIGEDVQIDWRALPEPALIKADRGQVEQIVMNLAVNARDAMPRGGILTIETACVDLHESAAALPLPVKPGSYVVLTVTDTGTGMTPEVQARLFEPFFTTKEPGKGTGLGMATVYGIVARAGGTVGVDSEVGRGTSFKVHFPKADPADVTADAPAAPAVSPRAGTHTVLVVEDEAGLRTLARRLLQRQGYTVLAAGDALEALRIFDEHPSIDIVLTDVVMPGTSGPELIQQLIERRPAVKVIYMSGYTAEAIVRHGVLQPGIAFLHKPFTSQTLGDKIREVLER